MYNTAEKLYYRALISKAENSLRQARSQAHLRPSQSGAEIIQNMQRKLERLYGHQQAWEKTPNGQQA